MKMSTFLSALFSIWGIAIVSTVIVAVIEFRSDVKVNKSEITYLTATDIADRPRIQKIVEEAPVEEEREVEEEKIETYEEVPLEWFLQEYAYRCCERYGVNKAFFLAMCESESSFDTDAVGDSGKSLGLMQINKCNWTKYDLDASMVYDNLEIGIRMLSELIIKYEEFDHVVMAYKGGEAFADNYIREGKRLSVCDEIAERTMYWQTVIEKTQH